jgi:hypothetical protein
MSSAIPIPAGVALPKGPAEGVTVENVFSGASIFERVFSFASMLGAVLVGWMFYALRPFYVDPDLWWHLKYGQGILATHHWPTVEQFSYTAAGQHWLAYEWLGDVLLAAAYQVAGSQGLGFLLIFLGSLFALALYYYTTVRCGNPKAGFLAAALLLNLANSFNLRPQMLAYVYLVFTVIVLERFRQGKRGAVWFLPFLMLLWVNTHGTWIIGLGVIATYVACGLMSFRLGGVEAKAWKPEERLSLVAAFALSGLATLITPYGAGLAKFPFIVSSMPSGVANVQEWQPIGFNLPGDKLFLALVLAFFLAQVLLRPKWRLEELSLFLAAVAMACLHLRFLLLFVVLAAPIFVTLLERWVPRYDRRKEVYALNAAIILGIAAAMVWHFPLRSDYAHAVEKSFPVAAVEYLNTHPVPEPLYNSYAFGGYLLWARGPEQKVFIDGRTEVYERVGVFQDQIALLNLQPGSLAVLDKYEIQSCLLVPGEPLTTVLAVLPGWQKVYAGEDAELFVRRQGARQELPVSAKARGDE